MGEKGGIRDKSGVTNRAKSGEKAARRAASGEKSGANSLGISGQSGEPGQGDGKDRARETSQGLTPTLTPL